MEIFNVIMVMLVHYVNHAMYMAKNGIHNLYLMENFNVKNAFNHLNICQYS